MIFVRSRSAANIRLTENVKNRTLTVIQTVLVIQTVVLLITSLKLI